MRKLYYMYSLMVKIGFVNDINFNLIDIKGEEKENPWTDFLPWKSLTLFGCKNNLLPWKTNFFYISL